MSENNQDRKAEEITEKIKAVEADINRYNKESSDLRKEISDIGSQISDIGDEESLVEDRQYLENQLQEKQARVTLIRIRRNAELSAHTVLSAQLGAILSGLADPGEESKRKSFSLSQIQLADPKNVQEVVAALLNLIEVYHNEVLKQAKHSFNFALGATIIGLIFFLGAVVFILIEDRQNAAILTLIAGTIVEVIAGMNFYLYGQTRGQMADYQVSLDRLQNYVVANSICEGLSEGVKDEARKELVRIVSLGGSPPVPLQQTNES